MSKPSRFTLEDGAVHIKDFDKAPPFTSFLPGLSGVRGIAQTVEANGQDISDVLARAAAECDADLIVMGTHGRRGLDRLLMGSDAEMVLRNSRVPVLMVREVQS